MLSVSLKCNENLKCKRYFFCIYKVNRIEIFITEKSFDIFIKKRRFICIQKIHFAEKRLLINIIVKYIGTYAPASKPYFLLNSTVNEKLNTYKK